MARKRHADPECPCTDCVRHLLARVAELEALLRIAAVWVPRCHVPHAPPTCAACAFHAALRGDGDGTGD